MTREIINTGSSANDGTGDSLRSGANKINANFEEIYEKFGTADVLSSRIEFDSDEILIQGVSGFKTSIGVVNPTQDNFTLIPNFAAGGSPSYFVLDSATQTLRNKTLDSCSLGTPFIADLSATHNYKVYPAELAADRLIRLPLLTGDDTFVMEAHTQTLTNKTLDSAVLNEPDLTGFIKNADAEPVVYFDDIGPLTANPVVNYLKIGNSTSGNDIDLQPGGTDTNITLRLRGKGTKPVLLEDEVAFGEETISVSGGTIPSTPAIHFLTYTAGADTKSIAAGSNVGQMKYIVNQGNFTVTVNSGSAALDLPDGNTEMDLDSATAHLLWDGSKWQLINQGHPKITLA